MMTQLVIVAYGIIFIAIVGLGTFFIIQRKKFNIKVILDKKNGNTTVTYFTRGGVFAKKRGEAKRFFIKKPKISIEPPLRKFYTVNKKGKDTIKLYMPDNETAYPEEWDSSTNTLKPFNYKSHLWANLQIREAYKIYASPSFWDRWGGAIVFGTTMIICVVLFIFTYKYFLDVSGQATAVGQQLSEASKILASAIDNLKGQTIQ